MSIHLKPRIGIHASSQKIEAYIRPVKKRFFIENNPQGIKILIKKIFEINPDLIALRFSNNSVELCGRLLLADLPVAIVSSKELTYFSNTMFSLSIDDGSKAGIIAYFATLINLSRQKLSSKHRKKLQNYIHIHSELKEIILQESKHLSKLERPFKTELNNRLQYLKQRNNVNNRKLKSVLRLYAQWEIATDNNLFSSLDNLA